MKTLLITFLASFFLIGGAGIEMNKEESKVEILGTSSLHDWESSVKEFAISGTIDETRISNLVATFDVKSIESGKSIMDDKTKDALKAESYPQITFKASSLALQSGKVSGTGSLTLAGETKPIALTADAIASGNKLKIKGETKLKMSDYGVDPPTAMFGTLTTGDEVTIKYEILLNN